MSNLSVYQFSSQDALHDVELVEDPLRGPLNIVLWIFHHKLLVPLSESIESCIDQASHWGINLDVLCANNVLCTKSMFCVRGTHAQYTKCPFLVWRTHVKCIEHEFGVSNRKAREFLVTYWYICYWFTCVIDLPVPLKQTSIIKHKLFTDSSCFES